MPASPSPAARPPAYTQTHSSKPTRTHTCAGKQDSEGGGDHLAQGQGDEDCDDKLLDHLLHRQLDVATEPRKLRVCAM